jgi:hypothetical protein
MQPYVWSGETFSLEQSMYTHQLFFDLESNSITKINSNPDWDLSFESSATGWHIRLNSGNYLRICQTNSYDFSISQYQPDPKKWTFDKSNGDPDSTAIGNWVNTTTKPFQYTGQVYLLGEYDGILNKPLKKLVFTQVNDTIYGFTYADLNGDNKKDVIIRKDSICNYTYFSIPTGQQVNIEPPRNNWDLLFTQYETILYDHGNPLPYYVRGVLINRGNVVAVDSSKIFEQISIADVPLFNFKTDLDIIGYNWKSVTIDIASNTAKYNVRSNYNYIIRNVKGDFYKLRFVSFYNKSGAEGYPTFEFVKL